jgi:cytochrome d ubiquinol oxidase subunit I
MKLAALEGVFTTQKEAPLHLFGIVNTKEQRVDYALSVPKLLSYLSFGDTSAQVQGLDTIPQKDWPRVSFTFQTYRLMIGLWFAMVIVSIAGAIAFLRGTLPHKKWLLRCLVASTLFPQIANQAGWVSAEMGRYPWIVHGLLRISDGLSKTVTANHVLGSMIMFTILYTMLFFLFLYLLNEKFKHGPEGTDVPTHYHALRAVAKGETTPPEGHP